MALEVNGKSVETDANGNLTDPGTWDEDVPGHSPPRIALS